MKAHHSQVDGVGGVRLLRRILSADPDARGMLPPWAVGTRGPDQSGLTVAPKPAPPARTSDAPSPGIVPRATAVAGGLARSTAAVAGSLGRTYAETWTGLGDDDRATPFRAPKSIFNGRIHTPRRFATQHYDMERLKLVAKAAEGSLNDVFLAISGASLRRYLLEQDALPEESLTANIPVSVRPADSGAGVGNAITFLYARLGTDLDDPIARMEAIKTSVRRGKERLPHAGPAAMDAYTAVLMAPFLGQAILGFGGRGRPASNLVLSNVPGPAETRYLDGAQMEEIYPVSLLFNGQALNITGVSYDGSFNIGYTGCRDSLPSLQHIAVYSGEELTALEEAYGLA